MSNKNFKVGDKVIVSFATKNDDANVGDCGIVSNKKSLYDNAIVVKFIEGISSGKFMDVPTNKLSKYIEPKHKVGEKLTVEDGIRVQIVKTVFNTKAQEWFYVMFCLKHGCPSLVAESDMPKSNKVMTLANAEKFIKSIIGRDVKITE